MRPMPTPRQSTRYASSRAPHFFGWGMISAQPLCVCRRENRYPFFRTMLRSLNVGFDTKSSCRTPLLAGYSAGFVAGLELVPLLRLADRDPDPLGGGRHVDVVDLVLAPHPFDDRIDHRRARTDRAGLARALDPQRVGLAGHVVGLEVEGRPIGRARHRIVHEGAGDELAVAGAIDRLLHQRLAYTLHGAAMNLAGEQQRIERDAEIVDDHVVDDL